VLYLAGPDSDYVTGQSFTIDGGLEMNWVKGPEPHRHASVQAPGQGNVIKHVARFVVENRANMATIRQDWLQIRQVRAATGSAIRQAPFSLMDSRGRAAQPFISETVDGLAAGRVRTQLREPATGRALDDATPYPRR